MRRLITLSLLAAAAVPAVTMAQDPQPQPRERVYSFSFGGDEPAIALARRGRLGVTLDMRSNPGRDSIGALIAGVTPGGAAERAGVRAGDIATRFNGTPLAGAPTAGEDAEDAAPAQRLRRLASRLDPGDTVRLEVRRDGRPQTFTFQAEESDMDMLVRRMEPFMDARVPGFMGEAGPGRVMVGFRMGPLDNIELVKNNAGLGANFGTSEGLVVTNVGDDSTTLGIRAGDVLLAIGGRRPSSPAHALRILSTYEPGETVSFDIMRQRRRMTVSGRMPEPREGGWRIRRNSFDLPAPDMHFMMPLPEGVPEMLPHLQDGPPEMLPHLQRVIIKV